MKRPNLLAEEPVVSAARFDTLVQQAASIREELNEIHWVDYREKQKLFADSFDVPGKTLKTLNDLVYYQGGYPSPNSPPKAQTVAVAFGKSFRLLWLIDRSNDLNKHLEQFGLKVVVVDKEKLRLPLTSAKMPSWFKARCKAMGLDLPGAWQTRDVLQWFVDYCCELQKTICHKANIIKKEIYPEAREAMSQLGKPDFRETVALRYRKNLVDALPKKERADGHGKWC